MKNFLLQTVVLLQIELWQQEDGNLLHSQKGSQPQCVCVSISI